MYNSLIAGLDMFMVMGGPGLRNSTIIFKDTVELGYISQSGVTA